MPYTWLIHGSRRERLTPLHSLNLISLPTIYPIQASGYSVVFMSSTGHTSTASSNFRLIIDALGDYANLTGIDLATNPFSDKLQVLNSPNDILQLLEEREKTFKDYRDGNRRLMSCLSPAVRVLHAFSGILGEAVSLVSRTHVISLFIFV